MTATAREAQSLQVAGLPPADPSEPVLSLEDFSVAYRTGGGDVKAVDHVDLVLHAGEVIGLAGESGSGKSTLAYGACRLLRPPAVITGGRVTYHGRRDAQPVDVLSRTPEQLRRLRWREIAIVFQSAMNALNPVLSIHAQLLDVIETHLSVSKADALERIGSLLDLVSIPRSRLKSYPHELSGGMRQRVMIAMALATNPEVVIMDEPTTALDVVVQRDILSQIVDLKNKLGFAVLFITHDLSLLLELADRVAVMYAGRLVEVGRSGDIHHMAAHPYTRGLLNSFPSLRGPRRELAGIPGTPPDLRCPPPGCPFHPRCGWATDACTAIDMRLIPLPGVADGHHVSACPFVLPDTPVPPRGAGQHPPLVSSRGPLPAAEIPATPPSTGGAAAVTATSVGVPGAGGAVGTAGRIPVVPTNGGAAPEPASAGAISLPPQRGATAPHDQSNAGSEERS